MSQSLNHKHNSECGHNKIFHNGHLDFIVGDKLHHPHGNHCDFHGNIIWIPNLNHIKAN